MQTKKFGEQITRILAENERRRREIPADFYSLMRLPNLFMYTQRNRSILRLLWREKVVSLSGRRILDVGCGAGGWLLDFLSWGANPELLYGIDIDEKQIAEAAQKLPEADLRVGNAAELPWPDAFFDIVFQATLFSSILSLDFTRDVAAEMMRVTKRGGLILWYDLRFNNPRNPHVRGICAREIKQLFPGCSFTLRRLTLLPPLARNIVPMSWLAALLLEKLPFLRTHILAFIKPRRESAIASDIRARPVPTFGGLATTPDDAEIYYSPMTRSLAEEVADLHILCFQDFFLTGLGRGVLTRYYNHYDGRPDSIFFVARSSSGKVVALVAGSRNYEEFLRTFYRDNLLALTIAIVKALFFDSHLRGKIRRRTPQIKAAITSLFQSRCSSGHAYKSDGLSPFDTAGLACVAVHPHFRGKGVAVELFRLFEEYGRKLGVRKAGLSVIVSNARAIGFYKKVGWHIASSDSGYIVFEKML